MPDAEQERIWRAEFDADGETAVRDAVTYRSAASFPEPKRQFAFRWLREQERARKLKERETRRYARWTLWAAIAAVAVGIVGVAITLFAH